MAQSLVIDGDQLKRLMKICRTIGLGKAATVQQLQSRLRTSRRTVFRDLNCLDSMGIKVGLGDKGYTIKKSGAACKRLLADCHTKALTKLLNACLK